MDVIMFALGVFVILLGAYFGIAEIIGGGILIALLAVAVTVVERHE